MTKIEAKLQEPSLDEQFGNLVLALLEILQRSGVQYFVFGSTALLARLPETHRLPGDIDIGVAHGGLETLKYPLSAAGFELVQRPGFSEIVTPKMRCHIVEGQFDLVVPGDQTLVGTYDFAETLRSTETATLRLRFFHRELQFPSPSLAETLFLCLLKPLNTTTVRDFCCLLDRDGFDVNRFVGVSSRCREAAAIVKERLRLLARHCEGRSREHIEALAAALPPEF